MSISPDDTHFEQLDPKRWKSVVSISPDDTHFEQLDPKRWKSVVSISPDDAHFEQLDPKGSGGSFHHSHGVSKQGRHDGIWLKSLCNVQR